MNLYDVNLQTSTSISACLSGDFSRDGDKSKKQGTEFVFAKAGGVLELYASDADTGSLSLLSSVRTFSAIRSLDKHRVAGSRRDQVVVGSDAGTLCLLSFGAKEEGYRAVTQQCDVFGRTGARRPTPGQYVACDCKGRAVMVAAIEKQKLVYVLNRDGAGKSHLSSPLEAHKSHTVTFALAAVDVGFENPLFAALEVTYVDGELGNEQNKAKAEAGAKPSKYLTYYELDLGLNHVTRRWTEKVAPSACLLASLPGGSDGPSGVIVAGEDSIAYHHESLGDKESVSCLLPRRDHHPRGKSILVTALTVHKQKKNKFFALAQTELGDLFKVTFEVANDRVVKMRAQLVDTLPLANSLNVTNIGLLFLAAEFGDHVLYQLDKKVVSLEGAVEYDSDKTSESGGDLSAVPTFVPSNKLSNMRVVDTLSSIAATTGLLIGEYTGKESSPQIYTLCGRGPRSSVRVLRHGAAITTLAVTDLPGVPSAMFSVAGEQGDDDKYIVVSFLDNTLVLSIGDTVEEVSDTSLVVDSPTIGCCRLADGGLVQVYPEGVRHVKADGKSFKDWQPEGLDRIEHASCNQNQVLVSFEGQKGKLCYFELDQNTMQLEQITKKEMEVEITCLDIGEVPRGRTRSMFAAIGTADDTVTILSLSPQDYLEFKSSADVQGRPSSVCLLDIHNADKNTVDKVRRRRNSFHL